MRTNKRNTSGLDALAAAAEEAMEQGGPFNTQPKKAKTRKTKRERSPEPDPPENITGPSYRVPKIDRLPKAVQTVPTVREMAAYGVKAMETQFRDYKTGNQIDRTKYLSASEAWNCIRRLKYEKSGYTKDPGHEDHFGFFERGHAVEDWFTQRMLHGANYATTHLDAQEKTRVNQTGQKQRTLTSDKRRLSATPDAHMVDRIPGTERIWEDLKDHRQIVEIKSIDPRTNTANLPKPEHVLQVQIQLGLAEEVMGVPYANGRLVYIDASDFSTIYEYMIWKDPNVLDDMTERARKLFNATLPEHLPAEGVASDQCRHCPFHVQCHAQAYQNAYDANDNVKIGDARMSYLEERLDKLNTLHEMNDGIKREIQEIQTQIRGQMEGCQAKTVDLPGHGRITYKAVKGRQVLDREKLESDEIDIDQYMVNGPDTTRLTVTLHKRKKKGKGWTDAVDPPTRATTEAPGVTSSTGEQVMQGPDSFVDEAADDTPEDEMMSEDEWNAWTGAAEFVQPAKTEVPPKDELEDAYEQAPLPQPPKSLFGFSVAELEQIARSMEAHQAKTPHEAEQILNREWNRHVNHNEQQEAYYREADRRWIEEVKRDAWRKLSSEGLVDWSKGPLQIDPEIKNACPSATQQIEAERIMDMARRETVRLKQENLNAKQKTFSAVSWTGRDDSKPGDGSPGFFERAKQILKREKD